MDELTRRHVFGYMVNEAQTIIKRIGASKFCSTNVSDALGTLYSLQIENNTHIKELSWVPSEPSTKEVP